MESGKPKRRELNQFDAFVAGGCGGIANVLIGHPFDTVKVRLQTSSEYKGLTDCVRKTLARDGVKGLYRGITAPLMGVTPMWAISFWGYELGQRFVLYFRKPNTSTQNLTLAELAFAGGFSSIPSTIVTTPMERLKVILQTQGTAANNSRTQYTGMIDAARGVFAESGIRGLYRGTVATLARDIPGGAAYFATYEFFYRELKGDGKGMSVGASLFAGGMSGVAMWMIAIPPDVVKSRIQSSPEGTYKSFMDCGRQIVKSEGVGALYRGFGVAMIRAFPANAAGWFGRMCAVEAIHKMKE